MTPDEYLEEVEFLRSCGTSDAQIATRLGVQPGSVAKAVRRAGRPDLAAPFERLANAARPRGPRDRKKVCPGCGGVCNAKSRACMACWRGLRRSEVAA